MKMNVTTFYILLILVIAVFFLMYHYFWNKNNRCDISCDSENYQPGDYSQMTHLPWATPPTGIGSLGEFQLEEVRKNYPPVTFYTGNVPISCPPSGIRIYETGNAENPNVYSAYGVIRPDEIRY